MKLVFGVPSVQKSFNFLTPLWQIGILYFIGHQGHRQSLQAKEMERQKAIGRLQQQYFQEAEITREKQRKVN